MLLHILLRTPLWVWALLALLLWLGWTQSRPRRTGLARSALMPVAMTGLSLYGLLSAFGAASHVLLAWCAMAAASAWAVSRSVPPAGARYLPEERRFAVPGSWMPMALTLAVFTLKYAMGVALVLHPGLAQTAGVATATSALYGLLSGLFAGRAVRLWKLALRPAGTLAATA